MAATKLQVLTTAVAIKAPVKAVSNAQLKLAGEQTISGIACKSGDRVLVKDQVVRLENGIYVVSAGAWERAADFDEDLDVVKGTLVTATDASQLYYRVVSDDPIVIGVNPVEFEPVSSTVTRSQILALLNSQTSFEDEIGAGLTPLNHQYPPLHLFRYMTAQQIEDVTSGRSESNMQPLIQAVIDFASTKHVGGTNYNPGGIAAVRIPAGKYRIEAGLKISQNDRYCHLVGEDQAVFYFTGSGTCLHIGNDSSSGIMPVHIKNINVQKQDRAAGSVGLKIEHASNGCYEEIGVIGFETGVLVKGAINCLFDFKRKAINGATYALRIESSQGSAGGLRFASNILTVKSAMIQACRYGVHVQTASGVGPAGAGGAMAFENITFESLDGAGCAVRLQDAGEVIRGGVALDEVVFRGCWFEGYGSTLATIASSRVKFQNCFIATGAKTCFELMDDASRLTLDSVFAYFVESVPTSGHLVSLGGTASSAAYKNITVIRSEFAGLAKLHADFPKNDIGPIVRQPQVYQVRYNAHYPPKNVDSNDGLVIRLFDEVNKLVGPGWIYCDVVLVGGGDDMGRVSLRLYKFANGYAVKDLDGNGTDYTLADTDASNATITFDGVHGRWRQMIGTFTPALV